MRHSAEYGFWNTYTSVARTKSKARKRGVSASQSHVTETARRYVPKSEARAMLDELRIEEEPIKSDEWGRQKHGGRKMTE